MSIVQDIFTQAPGFLENGYNLTGIIAAIIGGMCALKGIGYLETLRQRKAIATFSFEAQLYAYLYELNLVLCSSEHLLTNLYSETAQNGWGDKRSAPGTELAQFYNCAKETLVFIKSATDQMPAYESWGKDYRDLIQFLVELQYFDIRNTESSFKFEKKCDMSSRTIFWKSKCDLLERLLSGIEQDQNKKVIELFASENATHKSNTSK